MSEPTGAQRRKMLEAMDNHLARVRDVTAEVSRQLGPLERKAKRAREHQAATARLSEVRLALAVDDLHTGKTIAHHIGYILNIVYLVIVCHYDGVLFPSQSLDFAYQY